MKKQWNPSAVALVIELEQSMGREMTTWSVLVSRPGRDGVFSKSWGSPTGRLSEDQAKDLCAWVEMTTRNALVAWSGVQGTLL